MSDDTFKALHQAQMMLVDLRAILTPAIEAAREREKLREGIEYTSMSGYPSYANADWEMSDKALLEAARILGVE